MGPRAETPSVERASAAPAPKASASALREPPRGLILMALWFGLFTGLGETAVLAYMKLVLHQTLRLSPHFVWMAPVGEAFFFFATALILALLARRWSRLGSLATAGLVFSFLCFLSLLLLAERLHPLAMVLLAGGLAWQAARLIRSHGNAWRRFVARSVGVGAGLVLALLLGVFGWRGLQERRALANLPAPAPQAPNVMLIVLDTVRAQSLSLYGYDRSTSPELERWARAGLLFERAFATAPWTLPSHATMFTGRLPHELSADWQWPLDRTHPTIAEVFRSHGYVTAGFVANTFRVGHEHGLDRGFIHYEDFPVSAGEIFSTASLGWLFSGRPESHDSAFRRLTGIRAIVERKSAEEVNEEVLDWLPRRESRPFFVFLNYFDAHEPYLPPAPFGTRFGTPPRRKGLAARLRAARKDYSREHHLPADELRGLTDAYDGSLAYLDRQLGILLEQLRAQGVLENTIIVVTSDHGELLGEHGLLFHGNSLYAPLLHVPLLVLSPGRVPAAARVAEPVSLRDLAATLLDVAGVADQRIPGRSLARFWQPRLAEVPGPDTLFAEVSAGIRTPAWEPRTRGNMRSVIAYPFHYILNGDGIEELYDLQADPSESHDLATSMEGRREIPDLQASLGRLLAASSRNDSHGAVRTGLLTFEDLSAQRPPASSHRASPSPKRSAPPPAARPIASAVSRRLPGMGSLA